MTAFETIVSYDNSKDKQERNCNISLRAIPLHVPKTTRARKCSGGDVKSSADLDTASAQSRFVKAVSRAMSELLSGGYGREQASAILIRKIRQENASPDQKEVFDLMDSLGIGINEATRTLTVAAAVRKARVERGLSSSEAIDELTARLGTSKLLNLNKESLADSETTEASIQNRGRSSFTTSESSMKETDSVSSSSSVIDNQKEKLHSKHSKTATSSLSGKITKSKCASRRRTLKADDLSPTPCAGKTIPLVKDAHAVQVHLEIARKAKLSSDDVSSLSRDPSIRNTVLTSPAVKRSVAHLEDDESDHHQQPPLKRRRV